MDTTPQIDSEISTGRSKRKAGLLGGIVGSVGLAVSVFALSATAGAAAPTLAAQDTDTPPEQDVDINDVDLGDEIPAEWQAAYECMEGVAEKFGFDLMDETDGIGEGDIDEDGAEIDWDAFDAESAECEALLPQDVQDQLAVDEAEWEAYDTCINDAFEAAGIDLEGDIEDNFEFGPSVSIDTGDDYSFAEFGEGDGVITITKTGDDINVTTTGDVNLEAFDLEKMFDEDDFESFDEDAFDGEFENALDGCEDKLPEGIELDDLVVGNEPELAEN